jgi:hypothetical protein
MNESQKTMQPDIHISGKGSNVGGVKCGAVQWKGAAAQRMSHNGCGHNGASMKHYAI